MLIGPVEDATAGAPVGAAFSAAIANIGTAATAAVPAAAPLKNLRRDALGCPSAELPIFFDMISSKDVVKRWRRQRRSGRAASSCGTPL
jgi:hypothetical protein